MDVVVRRIGDRERAVVLVDPALAESVLEALEKTTGRAVERYVETASRGLDDHVASDVPIIYVGPVPGLQS
ncbi:hypothetical protein ACWCQN_42595 [Streptomyces sp. NPDC001984]